MLYDKEYELVGHLISLPCLYHGVNVLVLKFARLYVISVSHDVITIITLPQHIGRVPGA